MKTKSYCCTLLILLLVFIISCRHDPDTEFTSLPVGTYPELFLKTQVLTLAGGGGHGGHGDTAGYYHTGSIEFTYDSQKRLASANGLEFIYNNAGLLEMTVSGIDTIRYVYTDNRLSMLFTNCGYYEGGKFTDTTHFYYTGHNLRYLTSTHQRVLAEFGYDLNGNLVTCIMSHTDPGSVICDSLFYTWENGNLIKLQTRSGYPYVSYSYEREFRYDDHPSYISAVHYPEEYLFVREITQFYGQHPLFYYEVIPWRFGCRNNLIEFIERNNGNERITEFHIHYNEQGYPLEIHGGDIEMEFEYY